jgi:hypothetical protein
MYKVTAKCLNAKKLVTNSFYGIYGFVLPAAKE